MQNIIVIINEILVGTQILKDKYTNQKEAKATWICIFSHSEEEYLDLLRQADNIGKMFEEMSNGTKFVLHKEIDNVKILKIRKPDLTRYQRGDADFSLNDYESFKKEVINKPSFHLIKRENLEMIELLEQDNNVICYFSNPPVEKQYEKII